MSREIFLLGKLEPTPTTHLSGCEQAACRSASQTAPASGPLQIAQPLSKIRRAQHLTHGHLSTMWWFDHVENVASLRIENHIVIGVVDVDASEKYGWQYPVFLSNWNILRHVHRSYERNSAQGMSA